MNVDNTSEEPIDLFFVATERSLFRVYRIDPDPVPLVVKVAVKVGDEEAPDLRLMEITFGLMRAPYLGVTLDEGIFFFYGTGDQTDYKGKCPLPETMRPHWRPGTTKLKGIFLKQDDAALCILANGSFSEECREKHGREVIATLRDNPCIAFSRDPRIGFPETFFV